MKNQNTEHADYSAQLNEIIDSMYHFYGIAERIKERMVVRDGKNPIGNFFAITRLMISWHEYNEQDNGEPYRIHLVKFADSVKLSDGDTTLFVDKKYAELAGFVTELIAYHTAS